MDWSPVAVPRAQQHILPGHTEPANTAVFLAKLRAFSHCRHAFTDYLGCCRSLRPNLRITADMSDWYELGIELLSYQLNQALA